MSVINWLLLSIGDLVQWAWHALGALFAGLCAALDYILNPILSPVLAVLNRVLTPAADAVYAALGALPVWLGLTIVSAICGVLMLIAFKYLSNQEAIGRSRDRMSAHLLSLKLFKDDIGVTFRAQKRLFTALLVWQWHMLRPLFALIILLLPVFAQMGLRYQWRPLEPGEETLVRIQLDPNPGRVENAMLRPSPAITEQVGPVAGDQALVWRIRAGAPGRYQLQFELDGQVIEKELVVGNPFQRVSAVRPGHTWTTQLLHPAESRLPSDSPVQAIEIEYGGVDSWVYGQNWWILYFFIVSMLAAIALLPFFKVRF